ncbi:MAG: carboxylesterase family protein [Nocardioides sp.]|uniref:carboxylesterase/lipase family protein n=1 Tax=Nocardioides sp. TaxID=35761 RepID=UPI0039E71913
MSSTSTPKPIGRRGLIAGTMAAAGGAALLGPWQSSAEAAGSHQGRRRSPLTAGTIDSGRVRGVEAALDGVTVFKGIPYGASTAGENRWRVPQPVRSWRGVRVCDTWGDAAPQYTATLPEWADPPTFSEDCLNLNVWTAAADTHERRPVLLWLYGGAGASMWSGQPIWDGSTLAKKGVVVVTINYRADALGHLATAELSEEFGHGSGNWGHFDAIAALTWVRRNIHAFGGDADRVTLAGWSHGSSLAWVLLFSPLAKGLLQRCILESGVQYTKDPVINQVAGKYRSLAAAETTGANFMEYVGASSLAELRTMDAAELQTQAKLAPSTAKGFGTVMDGYLFPATYSEIFRDGSFSDIPILTGNNKDENGATPEQDVTLAEFEANATSTYGDLADEFLTAYPATSDAEASEQTNNADRDNERTSTYLWGTEWLESGARSNVYNYFWTHVPPGTDTTNPIIGDGAVGAFHGAEMYYVFGGLDGTDRPWTRQDYRIADKVSSYVANFAATGDPNGRGRGHDRRYATDACVRHDLPRWPALTRRTASVMELGDGFGQIPVGDTDARIDFQEDYLTSQDVEY